MDLDVRLTAPLEYPRTLVNTFSTEEASQPVHYIGKAFGLYFDGTDIRGGVSLRKLVDERYEFVTLRLVFTWGFPPVGLMRIPRVGCRQREVWAVQTQYHIHYFVSNGAASGHNPGLCGYRREVVGLAANVGVILTRELLDHVFGLIDAQLLELAERVVGPASGRSTPSATNLKVARA